MSVFQWQRPADSTPSTLAPMAAETSDSALLVRGNYVLRFLGRKPEPAELTTLLDGLRNVDVTVLPPLPGYLPSQDLVPNSERYIMGPASLARFVPAISPSAAGLHFGAVELEQHAQRGEAIGVVVDEEDPPARRLEGSLASVWTDRPPCQRSLTAAPSG